MRTVRHITDEMYRLLLASPVNGVSKRAWEIACVLKEYAEATQAEDASVCRSTQNVERVISQQELLAAYAKAIQEAPGGYVAPGLQDPDDASEEAARMRHAAREVQP